MLTLGTLGNMCARILYLHSHMCTTFPTPYNIHNALDVGEREYKMQVHMFPHVHMFYNVVDMWEHVYPHFVPAFPNVRDVWILHNVMCKMF